MIIPTTLRTVDNMELRQAWEKLARYINTLAPGNISLPITEDDVAGLSKDLDNRPLKSDVIASIQTAVSGIDTSSFLKLTNIPVTGADNFDVASMVGSNKPEISGVVIGGNHKAGVIKVLDENGNLIGYIGGINGGRYGAWFKSIGVGSSDPSTPKMYADVDGNLYVAGAIIEAGTVIASSGSLNLLGNITPVQPLIISFTTTNSEVTFSWGSQTVLRADGSSVSVSAGSLNYASLAASTTYFTYWYVQVSDGTLHQTNSNPPPTTSSAILATQCGLDGRIPIGVISFTTLAAGNPGTGGGTGGGGDACPEAAELVEIQGKGVIPASETQAGDLISGKSFKTGNDVYRRVLQVNKISCVAWRLIDGHRVSPCEDVFHDDRWMPAFRVPGSVFDEFNGTKVQISVESDEHNEQNYYLVGGTKLLIHNYNVLAC